MAKDLKEQIQIMTHYLNGGEVEYLNIAKPNSVWYKTTSPGWNWKIYNYRIKEKKQTVTIEKWLVRELDDDEIFTIESSDINVRVDLVKIKLLDTYKVEL